MTYTPKVPPGWRIRRTTLWDEIARQNGVAGRMTVVICVTLVRVARMNTINTNNAAHFSSLRQKLLGPVPINSVILHNGFENSPVVRSRLCRLDKRFSNSSAYTQAGKCPILQCEDIS
jgi:hypothetical protein